MSDKIAIKQCVNRRIMVIGDIMLDEYHWCDVKRISPEAPVPVCTVLHTTVVPGGAANVANNVGALSSTGRLLGIIGEDSSGDKLSKSIEKSGLATTGLVRTGRRPTILKSRIIAQHQQVVRVDREDASPLPPVLQRVVFARFEALLPETEAVILSDYAKGLLTPSFCKKVIARCRSLGIPVVVDPKGRDYRKYTGATILTPNFGEFLHAIGREIKSEKEVLEYGTRLQQKLQLEALLITRSEKGMSLIMQGKKIDIPTRAQEVVDITGAGDTVIAMLAIAMAAKQPLSVAAHLANAAAGVVVGKMGTATTTLADVEHALDDGQ